MRIDRMTSRALHHQHPSDKTAADLYVTEHQQTNKIRQSTMGFGGSDIPKSYELGHSELEKRRVPVIVVIDESETVIIEQPVDTKQINCKAALQVAQRECRDDNQSEIRATHSAVERAELTEEESVRDWLRLEEWRGDTLHYAAKPRPCINRNLPSLSGGHCQDSSIDDDTDNPITASGLYQLTELSEEQSMAYFHRRSHSHPDQLHLVMESGESGESAESPNETAATPDTLPEQRPHSHTNGSLHRKFSLPQDRHLHSHKNHSFSIEAEKLCEEPEKIEKDTGDDDMSYGYQMDEENMEDSLWNSRPSEFKLRDQFYSFFQASDNKLAMKLFGSRNALLKEKRRQMAAKTWIIHPCSNFRLYWDLLMLIFLVTNLVVLPVSIAFFYDDVGMHWIVFNITCDAMFILDIVINFRTGLIDPESHGNVILDPRAIALRYLKSWFAVDLVSSLPLDYVFLGLEGQSYSAGRALRILRLAKLLQLLRLLRISRLVRYVRLWKEFFSLASIVVKLFNLICVMVLMGHWSGCIQFFVPVIQGLPPDSWIVLNKLQHAHWWEQYSRSLFKALSHMLCIGYGQFPPRNMTDTWLTIASMLAGATCYALFIGHATTLIQSFDTSSRQFRDHLQQVNEYMIYRKLPTDLRRRITDFYDHRFGGKLFDEAAILSEISDCLRKDVIYHNCRELIKTVPFFVNADSSFVTDVITKLQFEMFQPADIIIKADTKGDRMFFIQEGLIEIITDKGKIVTRLGDGSYFGEICLLTQRKRTATVRAAAYCNLFSLSKVHFDKILENYPLMRRTLETIAAKRLHTLGKDPNIVTSRESLLEDIHGIQKVFQVNDPDSSDDDSDRSMSPTPSRESNSQFLTVVKSFFTKDSEEFSPTSRTASMKGLVPADATIPRCKSAVNATLSHLIMVPQSSTKMGRRAKSTADVQNFALASKYVGDRLFDVPKPRERRCSLSPMFKRKPLRDSEKSTSHCPNVKWAKSHSKGSVSQPSSPNLNSNQRPNDDSYCEDKSFEFPLLIPPQVKVTSQSNSTIDLPDPDEQDERVKFILHDDGN